MGVLRMEYRIVKRLVRNMVLAYFLCTREGGLRNIYKSILERQHPELLLKIHG